MKDNSIAFTRVAPFPDKHSGNANARSFFLSFCFSVLYFLSSLYLSAKDTSGDSKWPLIEALFEEARLSADWEGVPVLDTAWHRLWSDDRFTRKKKQADPVIREKRNQEIHRPKGPWSLQNALWTKTSILHVKWYRFGGKAQSSYPLSLEQANEVLDQIEFTRPVFSGFGACQSFLVCENSFERSGISGGVPPFFILP